MGLLGGVWVPPRPAPGTWSPRQSAGAAPESADANDAITKTAAQGFAKGSIIFLDLERMDFVPTAMRQYYQAWTKEVLADGEFTPGYYAHSFNADVIYRDVKQAFIAARISKDPPFWIASSRGFAPDKDPTDVGHSFAQVWQGLLDVVGTHNGGKTTIGGNRAGPPPPPEFHGGGELPQSRN